MSATDYRKKSDRISSTSEVRDFLRERFSLSKKVRRNPVYLNGPAFEVYQDEIYEEPDTHYRRDVVYRKDAVCMIPIDEDGDYLFVAQYRHPAWCHMIELPAGVIDEGEEPIDAAIRELREETGYWPGEATEIMSFYVSPGYSTEYMHVFVCDDLEYDPLPSDENEDITIVKLNPLEAQICIAEGYIEDAKTIAAILRLETLRC